MVKKIFIVAGLLVGARSLKWLTSMRYPHTSIPIHFENAIRRDRPENAKYNWGIFPSK